MKSLPMEWKDDKEAKTDYSVDATVYATVSHYLCSFCCVLSGNYNQLQVQVGARNKVTKVGTSSLSNDQSFSRTQQTIVQRKIRHVLF